MIWNSMATWEGPIELLLAKVKKTFGRIGIFILKLLFYIANINIDSLDGFTFRNQLMSIMLVMATGQHLHTIISFRAYP